MDQSEAEIVIEWFVDLESRLKAYLKSVPINWNHQAILPLLSGIIVEAAGLIDSIFRKEFDMSETDKLARKNLIFKDFSNHYEKKYSLDNKKTLLYQYPPILLTPFLGWTDTNIDYTLTLRWWDAYNKLKHQRIDNYTKCTLDNAVYSMCALHQVLAALPCFIRTLIAHDLVSIGNWPTNYVVEVIEQGTREIPVLFESNLFATPCGILRFPDDAKNIYSENYGGSRRLEKFLGR